MSKKYKLVKELPTFNLGDRFLISNAGNLCLEKEPSIVAYAASTLKKFPNILNDWFEEIPEEPKTVWDLEGDMLCWEIGVDCAWQQAWCNIVDAVDKRRVGDITLTKEEAYEKIARRKAKVILERDTKGFKPNFTTFEQVKYHVDYSYQERKFITEITTYIRSGQICFATEEDAECSIDNHPEEWKTYLGVEE